MNKKELDFLKLCKNAIYNKTELDNSFTETDWDEMYKLAAKNKMKEIIFDAVKLQQNIPEDLLKRWSVERFKGFVRHRQNVYNLLIILEELKKEKIEYVLLKGEVLANLYPTSGNRVSSDSDILVKPAEFEKVIAITEKYGFLKNDEHSKPGKVAGMINLETGQFIEIHTSLRENYEGDKISLFDELGKSIASNNICILIDRKEVWTLNYTDHLLFQIFHMIKHFILEGAGVRFMTDMSLYINKYFEQIDLKYLWNKLDELGYAKFMEKYFYLCVEYFDMDKKILDGRKAKVSKKIMDSLLTDIIYVGDKDEIKQRTGLIIGEMREYFTGANSKVERNKLTRALNYAFPKNKTKKEILIRFVTLPLKFKKAKENKKYTPTQRIKIIGDRKELLAQTGLVG